LNKENQMKRSHVLIGCFFSINMLQAAQLSATVTTTEDNPKPLGEVIFTDTAYGMLISPKLTGLSAGLHGFHLHQHPNCGVKGMEAGGHFDPTHTNSHKGPYAEGHLGDLPVLYVSEDGQANTPTLAPRLKSKDLLGLTLMIHAHGDNYSDTPSLGGGGDRVACGAIK
jgi:Cu-Zn family superoxide dismutase